MNKPNAKTLDKNPKIDQKVVAAATALVEKLPKNIQQHQGSNYRISPALGGNVLTSFRRANER